MAYATIQYVKSLCPLVFNRPTGYPDDAEITFWLNEGAAIIDAMIQSKGYTVPSSTGSAYPLMRNLNGFYAAAMVEQSRMAGSVAEGATSRGEKLEERFWNRLEKFMRLDLSQMGMTHTSEMYIGGISEAEKETVESDDDRIMHTFRRGQFANPGAGTTSARTPSDPQERSD